MEETSLFLPRHNNTFTPYLNHMENPTYRKYYNGTNIIGLKLKSQLHIIFYSI